MEDSVKTLFIFLVFVFFLSNIYSQVNLDSGLVAYYPFNGNADDATANGINGTIYGAIPTNDRFGNPQSAFHFDGIDDYIDLANPPILNLHEAITVSAWAQVSDTTSENMIISKWKYYSNTQGSWGLFSHSFVVAGSNGTAGITAGYDSLQQTSDYKHYVGTYTQLDNFIRYYENGILIDSVSGLSGSIFVSNSKVLIGAAIYLFTYYFTGDIDDIRIYNRALSQEEVDSLFHEPPPLQLTVSVNDGWNMVSVPGVNTDGQGVEFWWPGRDPAANVFKYTGGYTPITSATPGEGYWMKNAGAQTYNTGDEWPAGGIQIVPHNPINALAGWNLIGGYENTITTSGLTTTPPGLIDGPVYEYSGGYNIADNLVAGYGYWIKLSGDGQINLSGTLTKESCEIEKWFNEDWGKIILTDASGINYTLYAVKGDSPDCKVGVDLNEYELPPAPPEGMFDIRFESGRIAEDIKSSVKTIDMSGITYPLTVKAENIDIRLMDETGKTVNVNLKKGEDVVISDATIQKLMVSSELIPDVYSLEQNYPNPFNPSTIIEFSLPEEVSSVTLSIYNVLGEKVAELVNTSLIAGKYSYQWNAKDVATGMYIYELRTDKFVSVKKMVLIK